MKPKIYPTDLSNAEWHRIARLVPGPKPGGRPCKYSRREILNAIFYIARSGSSWRMMPTDLPNWRIAYYYFARWSKSGWWKVLHDQLRAKVRSKEGRRPQATAAIIDSQSVKTAAPRGVRGYDAAKKVKGRKRHLLVDTLGLLLLLLVHPADVQDRDGAKSLLAPLDSMIWTA